MSEVKAGKISFDFVLWVPFCQEIQFFHIPLMTRSPRTVEVVVYFN